MLELSRFSIVSLTLLAALAIPEGWTAERERRLQPRDAQSDSEVATSDADGREIRTAGEAGPRDSFPGSLPTTAPSPCGPAPCDHASRVPNPAIERIAVSTGYKVHNGGDPLTVLGFASTFFLSDGSTWQANGYDSEPQSYLEDVEVDGDALRYHLYAPADGVILLHYEYSSAPRRTSGSLSAHGELVLETTAGSAIARLSGEAVVLTNEPAWEGDPAFHYYATIPGARVRFEMTYTMFDGTWQADSFGRTFTYSANGTVDLAHPTFVPAAVGLDIRGSAQVPPQASVPYVATLHFENGVARDVTGLATWSATPAGLVSITGGVLSTGTFQVDRQPVSVRAVHVNAGTVYSVEKSVVGRLSATVGDADTWPTYQADARHRGFVPQAYEPNDFQLRWQRSLRPGYVLNPVAAAEGRVFASALTYFGGGETLFALDAVDGELLWSKDFGSIFSVNPPAWAYGNVYIQTGNHGGDSWLRALDAESGAQLFRVPFSAQWERYLAPTVHDGTVYVNGGYYGGMYAFDAFAGQQRWFVGLPQYDQWTPAVSGDLAYAYLGEYTPGLYVRDRHNGQARYFIEDPDFDWSGWSMGIAPAVLEDGDALGTNAGRLIRFDLEGRRVLWQRHASYRGQPAVAGGVIYAINGSSLEALDEATGSPLWSWPSPTGEILPAFVVTTSHVFLSTYDLIYAVDLVTRGTAWSYPAGGYLALGDDNLYIARNNGTLVAIAAAPIAPMAPDSIEIVGPDHAQELSSVAFKAFAHYPDGRVRDRTRTTTWSVSPATYASMEEPGILEIGEMLDLTQSVILTATFTEAGGTVQATHVVDLAVSVHLDVFIERNRVGAQQLHVELLQQLEQAMARESAILRALGVSPDPDQPEGGFPTAILRALRADIDAAKLLEQARDALIEAGAEPPGEPSRSTPPEGRRGAPRDLEKR